MTNSSNLRVAVIGGGPGGYAAAFLAADLGMKVTLHPVQGPVARGQVARRGRAGKKLGH
jgi:pyruvate/2-oxoglutarate dehydrogenase complex dihydrolipoamide dehydrogenase (E3) component